MEGLQGMEFRIEGSEREGKQDAMIIEILEAKEGMLTSPAK